MGKAKFKATLNSYWYFNHIKFSVLLAFISVVLLIVAIHAKCYENGFWSGLLINISSGIITGVFFCFLTGLKKKQIKEISLT